LDELGTEVGDLSDAQVMSQFHQCLRQERSLGRYVIAILDDAHSLPSETIDKLIQLTGFEIENDKLIKFILVGEKTLLTNLANISQDDRFAITACIENLDKTSALEYIRYRLSKASPKNFNFPGKLAKEVVRITAGNPRAINTIMERLIVAAFLDGSHKLKFKHLHNVLNSMNPALPLKREAKRGQIWAYVLAVFFMVTVTGFVGYREYVKFESKGRDMLLTSRQNIGETSAGPVEPLSRQTEEDSVPEHETVAVAENKNNNEDLPEVEIVLKFAYVNVPVLNVRSAPNVSAERVGTVRFGQKVIIKEELNEWSLIELVDGQLGWAFKQYVRSE
jgi:hypothetical protein